ncbi:MAG: hypothetical protein IKU10_07005 [Clostridia bacterium]|nr:hypothetical protein [Clostridia bacterium]
MKKVVYIIVPILVLAMAYGAVWSVSALTSPEYTLQQIANDAKEAGMDGLTPYLTDNAKETVDHITPVEDDPMDQTIYCFLDDGRTGVLKANLEDVAFTLVHLDEGEKEAYAVVAFDYQGELVGEMELELIAQEDGWKINTIHTPTYENE